MVKGQGQTAGNYTKALQLGGITSHLLKHGPLVLRSHSNYFHFTNSKGYRGPTSNLKLKTLHKCLFSASIKGRFHCIAMITSTEELGTFTTPVKRYIGIKAVLSEHVRLMWRLKTSTCIR